MNNLDLDNMTIDELTVALKLDQEERELLESIEHDEWVSIPNEKEEMERLQKMARNQLARRRIEFEMSIQDTAQIYALANQLEQSVSTLVQDVVHKYLRGELVEKK
jgi:predicted nucleic acid-binding protein